MNVNLTPELAYETIEMRTVYCDTLCELAERDRRIMALDADLMVASGTGPFARRFPRQFVECGVQEANMLGVAAGLSATGCIPFAHTFAPFCTRRACDQIFVSCAYARLNVKVVGSDPGVTAALNGGTHMPFEDAGIMRGIPGVTVIEPTDTTMLKAVIRLIAGEYGVHYLRLARRIVPKIYESDSSFKIGQAVQLRAGSDLTLMASGYCVAESLKAAELLAKRGISARVMDMFTLKPIDQEAVIKAARETGAIITAENHNVINGLGSAVAEVLAENAPVPQERIGVRDLFGEVGPAEYLAEKFGLSAPHIATAAEKALRRK